MDDWTNWLLGKLEEEEIRIAQGCHGEQPKPPEGRAVLLTGVEQPKIRSCQPGRPPPKKK